jgi:hypothetical protein
MGSPKGDVIRHVNHRIATGLLATVAGVLVLAFALTTGQSAAFATGDRLILNLFGDRSATGSCDTTFTGTHTGAINVSVGTTCLLDARQTGAINVAPGAALSVRRSVVTGAITLVGARAFTFCNSSTVGGAINSTTGAGFVLIGDGGDHGLLSLLSPACGSNHIDGAVTLSGNVGGVEIGGSAIGGALTVSGNVAPGGGSPIEDNATEIEGNTVTGLTTCADNNPAPTNDGSGNTFTGSATGQCAGL